MLCCNTTKNFSPMSDWLHEQPENIDSCNTSYVTDSDIEWFFLQPANQIFNIFYSSLGVVHGGSTQG